MGDRWYYLALLLVAGIPLAIPIVVVRLAVGIWWHTRIRAWPDIVVFDPAQTEMPPDVRSTFAVAHDALVELGFRYLRTMSLPEVSNADFVVFALYEHPIHHVRSTIAAHHARLRGRLLRGHCYLTFVSEALDGTKLVTSNLAMLRVDVPKRVIWQLPDVTNPARLFQLHQALVHRTGKPLIGKEAHEKFIANADNEFREIYSQGFAALAERGILMLQPDGETYRFTLTGAFRHALLSLSFWKRWKLLKQSRELVAQLEREGLLAEKEVAETTRVVTKPELPTV